MSINYCHDPFEKYRHRIYLHFRVASEQLIADCPSLSLRSGDLLCRPVARGCKWVQLPPPPPPPPLDARSAWQAMNIIHFIAQSTHILIIIAMCTSACKSTGTGSNQGCSSRSGIWAMARPFLPKVHLEKEYTCTDKIVCIYPVWIIIYHIDVSSQVPSPTI